MKFLKSSQLASLKSPNNSNSQSDKPRDCPALSDSSFDLAQHEHNKEPKSAPSAIPMMPKVCVEERLETLNDSQLTQLTRSNTRKNLGGRKRRFRSQMERVRRCLDTLGIDSKLHSRASLTALPVVRPDRGDSVDNLAAPVEDADSVSEASHNDSPKDIRSTAALKQSKSSSSLARMSKRFSLRRREKFDDKLDNNSSSDDSLAIEPATNDSLFSNNTFSTKSLTPSGQPKSVRISTAVTLLDYRQDDQPISISKMERFNHPTRNDRNALMRRANAQDVDFRRARIQRLDCAVDESCERGQQEEAVVQDGQSEGNSPSSPQEKKSPGCRVLSPTAVSPSTGRKPLNVAYATPTPEGPYGPPELPE